jgi:hypothetical protein
MKHLFKKVAIVGALFSLVACDMDYITNLDTENKNQPDLRRALTNPSDVESMIASSWRPHWNYIQGWDNSNVALSAMAHEITSTVGNFGVLELSLEPRSWAFNNHPAYSERWLNQSPWYALYGGLASANDGLRLIKDGMRIRTGSGAEAEDHTARAQAFGKFVQGVTLGHIGWYFDQAIIATEDTDLTDPASLRFVKYTEVRDQAIKSLEEAIAIAEQNTFMLPSTPGTWFPNIEVDNRELARIANSYIARILAYTPRTPQERQAVDWNRVISHIDRGITRDHAPVTQPSGGITAIYRAYTHHSWFRTDYRVVGPGDISGRYQQWINAPVGERDWFQIESPDRRIHGEAGPASRGKYFTYTTLMGVQNPDRGRHNFSHYAGSRYSNMNGNGLFNNSAVAIMPLDEMNLLKAEALFRLNRRPEAAALVNQTRVANGELPPVTADGVPQSPTCAPRKDNGACGDLWDALMYEKRIETVGTMAPLAWMDRRGWGTLARGTMTQLPVPGRELETLSMPMYTFGGDGEGSAQ